MSDSDLLAFLRDPHLGDVAAAALPSWLWEADGSRVLWANAAGAALFGSETVAALAQRRFDPRHPTAQQVKRVAAALPSLGARLERLRGFNADLGRLLMCRCRRLPVGDGTGIFISATEAAGAQLPLAERVRRLIDGTHMVAAAFSPEGTLLHATPEAAQGLADLATPPAAAELVATALAAGRAEGDTAIGHLTVERIGSGGAIFLLAILAPAAENRTSRPTIPSGAAAGESSGIPTQPAAAEPRPAPERRQPLRFVWQIDADGRFHVASQDFAALFGPNASGRPWLELAAGLGLDPEQRVAQALASRDTFSGITVAWPIDGIRLPVELSGLPIFDGQRAFHGYRGFGICRDSGQLAEIAATRQAPAPPMPPARDGEIGSETGGAPLPSPERPQLTIVPPAKNVVPFRSAGPGGTERRPPLSPLERNAFQEIAAALGARLEGRKIPTEPDASSSSPAAQEGAGPAEATASEEKARTSHRIWPRPIPSAYAAGTNGDPSRAASAVADRAVLDRIPVAILVFRGDQLLLVNRALLDWTGYEDVEAIAAAGGLARLLAAPGLAGLGEPDSSGQRLAIVSRNGDSLPVEGRLFSIPWHDGSALLIVLNRTDTNEQVKAAEDAVRAAERRIRAAEAALAASDERLKAAELSVRSSQAAKRELESVLETATDGVLVVDRDGMILASNRSAEALFGYESHEMIDRSFLDLFAPESHRMAHQYLDGLIRQGFASVLNDGREVIGRVREGGLIPLFMTIGPVDDDKFCIVFRDITQWKRAEEDLTNAKRAAERASSAKSDVLAKVSHEIRTPLNAIIGFAEVMLEERLGPLGSERYREYLRDIRTTGEHIISLVNDLLDLSKIEAGKLDLTFVSVSLNDVIQQCVAIMQPQANRERIIIRTSLLPTLPPVVADERSIRQIVLNLLSNSIKFTGAGGQVIVSTALTGHGEAVLRVRDTGIGMSEKEIETALEPFRQLAGSSRGGVGTGLGLPLSKVLAEANRATFTIKSAIDAGTLVEIIFPATRVLAE